jgi:hypothetical protein
MTRLKKAIEKARAFIEVAYNPKAYIRKVIKFPKSTTLKKFNDLIKGSGYELYKGSGYFYFGPRDDADDNVLVFADDSEMIYRFNNITPDEWYGLFQDKLKGVYT